MTVIFWRLIETFRDLEVERSVYVDLSHRSSFSFTNPQMRGKAGKAGMVKDKQIFDTICWLISDYLTGKDPRILKIQI